VEDEPAAAQVISKGLREHAYAVDVAADGEAALAQVDATDYDAIVLDLMIPLKDGMSVCRAIRQAGRNVPILIVTARDAVDARVEGLDAGADEYLTKPVEHAALVARVKSMLRIKGLHDTVQEQTARLGAQAAELSEWNRTLEQRVQQPRGPHRLDEPGRDSRPRGRRLTRGCEPGASPRPTSPLTPPTNSQVRCCWPRSDWPGARCERARGSMPPPPPG